MTELLVDSNVLLDVFEDDPTWADWSQSMLDDLSQNHTLVINPIVYSEVSIGFGRIEELENALGRGGFRMRDMPKETLFLAGKAFLKYRKRKDTKITALPDFFIGAHAAVAKLKLLTRDPKRMRSYFPSVELVAPD
jgi:predicted nucleic acid-binding protein